MDTAHMGHHIQFEESGIQVEWTGKHDNLLEMAEEAGLALDFGCREGNCTACQQKIVKGKVSYPNGHAGEPEDGNELLCCSIPESDLVIEA